MADIVVSAAIETSGAAAGARSFNAALASMRTGVAQTGNAISGAARSVLSFRGALAGIGFSALAREAIQAGDAFQNLKARLSLAAGAGETAAGNLDALNEAAVRARAPVGQLADVYLRNSGALQQMGVGTAEGIRLAETLSKVTTISGTSAIQAAAGMGQLSQAIASGRFQGDEFKSVAENIPEVMRIFQRETGKTAGELRKLSSEGKITSEVIVNVLANAAAEVDAKFAQMPLTVGAAWAQASDAISQGVGKAMEAEGATRSWANALEETTKLLQSDAGIALFDRLAGAMKFVGDGFAAAAREARVMAEETKLAAKTAQESQGFFIELAKINERNIGIMGKLREIGRLIVTGKSAEVSPDVSEQAVANVNWNDATKVTRGDGSSPAKRKIVFGSGTDDGEVKKLERIRAELSKNIEVERMRAAITRAEIDGNDTLAGHLRTQLEIRTRISDDMRKADPAKAAALAQEIALQNDLEKQLRAVQQVKERDEEVMRRNTEAARELSSTLVQGFASSIAQGNSFSRTLRDVGARLFEVAAQAALLKPLENSLAGMISGGASKSGFDVGGLQGVFSSMFSGPTLSGWSPTVTAFANGGVVNGPTRFAGAGMQGVMGEAGPEAILPLRRGPGGALGVAASGAAPAPNNIYITIEGDATDATLVKMQQVAEMTLARLQPNVERGAVSAVRREIVNNRHFMRR